jgi:gentisate 1,2-dioxygenase
LVRGQSGPVGAAAVVVVVVVDAGSAAGRDPPTLSPIAMPAAANTTTSAISTGRRPAKSVARRPGFTFGVRAMPHGTGSDAAGGEARAVVRGRSSPGLGSRIARARLGSVAAMLAHGELPPLEPAHALALEELYRDFATASCAPLWLARGDLMPTEPTPRARAAHWRWSTLRELATRAGELVEVGRGGERRAIALANPGLGGEPFATPTLWAAIQYLRPGEAAPAHRHTQSAFRFVLEGSGVFTNVDGDEVAMERGDLLLTSNWSWHEHHNTAEVPMAWLDGLDIPLVSMLDASFFEFGPDTLQSRATPRRSRSERLYGHPGIRPVGIEPPVGPPLVAFRYEHTSAAMSAQLELEAEGAISLAEPGHAAVRFVDPLRDVDALSTMRTEMHRLAPGAGARPDRVVGSSVWQLFCGEATADVAGERFELAAGDLFVVPSYAELTIESRSGAELFMFSDAPLYEALHLDRRPTR